ncbi:MAG: Protein-L-isoaspartate O-methyltransferase [Alphaproteobacteria bacterium MarineAlpha4_Bin2]|nr:MAG: Protein-L-isoaspartate O-methyltransferase [Alphaproteobacteria bacterium MarineAlpha4_Bin2]
MDFVAARENMIECQLRTNKVTDKRILNAMSSLPRERFVSSDREHMAYVDVDVPCGNGRNVMAAMVSARLIQEAAIQKDDEVLCIGAGTGYSVAVMAGLASSVIALENDKACAAKADELFAELDLDNAVVVEGQLVDGWGAESPYDVIFFDGMISEVPSSILEQLGDGGRLLAIVDSSGGIGRATLFVKVFGNISSREIFDINVGRLTEFDKKQEFVF